MIRCTTDCCPAVVPAPPATRAARWQAWLEVARVSNLPTVGSNVLTGVALSGVAPLDRWPETLALAAVVALFYIGGMAMNDALDAPRDRLERPHRPIPSGRVRRCDVKKLATVCLTLATGLTAAFGWAAFGWGVALLAAIVGYNALHMRYRAAALLMGLCRGLIYVLAASAFDQHMFRGFAAAPVSQSGLSEPAFSWPGLASPELAALAAGLTLYTLFLTTMAADEASAGRRITRWAACGLPVAGFGPAVWLAGSSFGSPGGFVSPWFGLAASSGLVWTGWTIWLALRPGGRVVRAVLAALAGLALVDAAALAALNRPAEMGVALGCFVLARVLQPRIAAT